MGKRTLEKVLLDEMPRYTGDKEIMLQRKGKKLFEKIILEKIIDYLPNDDRVTFVGSNERMYLIASLFGLGVDVNSIDYDPKFEDRDLYDCKDAIFDDVDFAKLVVVFNAEKHYPLGKIYKGKMIVIGDNDKHNGDCNPISSCAELVRQNNFQSVDESFEFDKWFVAIGNSYGN